ncbi:unnamed protein product [Adineta ricciae]|uniref:Calcineurin-like phosphoesterase domain-containing protein n=1 Tax=Adineta ricciae TaxID=249248 RepID=A0A814RUR3_ADIRI|nr:unnamed protein product [Adineta ricciae]
MVHQRPYTRLVCISATHSCYSFDLLDGNILLHAGGISRTDKGDELYDFLDWRKNLMKFRLKLFITGNHDVALDGTYYESH